MGAPPIVRTDVPPPSSTFEAGLLLTRASQLAPVQTDAARDMIVRAAILAATASDEELRTEFLPATIQTFATLADEGDEGSALVVNYLIESAVKGPDESRAAVVNILCRLAGIEGD